MELVDWLLVGAGVLFVVAAASVAPALGMVVAGLCLIGAWFLLDEAS